MSIIHPPERPVVAGRLYRMPPWVVTVSVPAGRFRTLRGSNHRPCIDGHVNSLPLSLCLSHPSSQFQLVDRKWDWDAYLNPNFRYPAASLYHSAKGATQRLSQGRAMMNGANDGADMMALLYLQDLSDFLVVEQTQNRRTKLRRFWIFEVRSMSGACLYHYRGCR